MQSTRNGKIVVTCWDGNDYLFEEPNLDFIKDLRKKKNKYTYCKS